MDLIQNYVYIESESKENKENNPDKMKLSPLKILLFFSLCVLFFIYIKNAKPYKEKFMKSNVFNYKNTHLINFNKYYVNDYFKSNDTNADYFNLTYLNFSFSYRFKLVKVEYYFNFYDKNNNTIPPAELVPKRDYHVNCHIEIVNDDIHIDSLADIIDNKYFKCVEFFNVDERIKFGVKLYKIIVKEDIDEFEVEYYNVDFFKEGKFRMNNFLIENSDMFHPYVLNDEYVALANRIQAGKGRDFRTMKSYVEYPYCILKRNSVVYENKWFFRNIYNHYFCLCKGKDCIKEKMNQACKFSFYLHIIENNKHLFPKTDYLFNDFFFKDLSTVDAFPIFNEMLKQNQPVHYLTENVNISGQKYAYDDSLTIVPINRDNCTINGDFIEKFLLLILKLKVVVSARDSLIANTLFYTIDYITYIFIGHGVGYFKEFLYREKYFPTKKFDKIVLPASEKILSVPKKYGWTDDDFILMNLPRWDNYNLVEDHNNNTNRSIYMMFSWRDLIKEKDISEHYMANISFILKSKKLNDELAKNKVKLYFGAYYTSKFRSRSKFRKIILKNPYMEYVDQHNISHCLSTAQLVVTDFLSIIFDLMYRKKPYIMFIPDLNDTGLRDIYKPDYVDLIESFKNRTEKIENQFFNPKDVVNKIVYYIKRNFKLDKKLKDLYDSFGLKPEYNNTYKFIEYIKNLK